MAHRFLSVVFVLLAFIACNCTADLINDVCSKTENPTFCNEVLRSDPRSHGADLSGLGRITIDKSLEIAIKVQNLSWAAYVKTKTGPLETCVEDLEFTKDYLHQCYKALKSSDKETLVLRSYAALSELQRCDHQLKFIAVPTELKAAIVKGEGIMKILKVIAKIL